MNTKSTRIASFDCGVKTLAYVVVDVSSDIVDAFDKSGKGTASNYTLKKEIMIGSKITQAGGEIIDLTNGSKAKDYSVIDRVRFLIKSLEERKANFAGIDMVLIEDQPPTNAMAREIMTAIITYFLPKTHVEIVLAKYKNRVAFGSDLSIENYKKKTYSSYHANKNQSVDNNAWFIKETEKKKYRKKDLCNIADAFMQILGWRLAY